MTIFYKLQPMSTKLRGGSGKKRCPKGTRKNKVTGQCESSSSSSTPFVPYKGLPRDYVATVKEIISDIKEGRRFEKDLDGLHIEGEEFISTSIHRISLQNAMLTNTVIKHSKFENVNLGNTWFNGAKLENVQFTKLGRDMDIIMFPSAKLTNVTFSDMTRVSSCDFHRARLKNVVFDHIHISGKKEIEESITKAQAKEVTFTNVYGTLEDDD
jgi:Pentapeptide repeats (9 copies)